VQSSAPSQFVELNTSAPLSPDTSNFRSRPKNLELPEKKATRKTRSVIGRLRELQRKAAARMAHSPIRIDTSANGLKRGFPHDGDSEEDVESAGALGSDDASVTDASSDLPRFLTPSVGGK
jgi:hypothetical protein